MMRSMFSGVTGLKNHQTKMDVIGNNIANVNTVGFKKGRATFQDALNQTMRGASSPEGNRGGTNPMQVGLGMTIASIDTIHSPSSMEYTGNMTDMGIEGDGFFIVSDGAQNYYTRAGNFTFDELGNLVTMNGLKVKGWQDKEELKLPSDMSPQNLTEIQVNKGVMMPAKETTKVKFAKNLDAGDVIDTEKGDDRTYNYVLPFKVYDSLGEEHTLYIGFNNEGKDTEGYKWTVTIGSEFEDGKITDGTETGNLMQFNLEFGDDGKLIEVGDTADNSISEVILELEGLPTAESGAEGKMKLTLDFSQLTQYAKETTVDLASQDGYAAGALMGVTADSAGVITGVFDNGHTKELAQMALANFDNPGGLIKGGQNLYKYSNNSGEPQIGKAGSAGRGAISPGALEMSNVDLSEEFTQMITTQRGFQANSRIITTSDEMLQELVNLKR